MTTRVAINGFGRIGRLVLRAIVEQKRKDLEIVAVNDLGSVEMNAHLLQWDTIHGQFPGKVKATKSGMDFGRGNVPVFAERDPAKLPWKKLGVDVALECTGFFTDASKAKAHIDAGARRVLISAPATGEDITVVRGVNHTKLKKSHRIISNASCTTNCLAPVVYVLHKAVGFDRGFMTTVHSYTGDQRLQDTLHKDPRRARAAAHSQIPTSTGAAKAVGLVLPELKGRIDGTSVRVPTINVSMIDLTFVPKKKTSIEEINAAIKKAANGPLKGVLAYTDQALVSSDFNHNPASSIFDSLETQVVGGDFVRVLSWYDNEWGFSNRMADVAAMVGKLG